MSPGIMMPPNSEPLADAEVDTARIPSAGSPLPTWLLATALAMATYVAYCPALHNGFVEYDDPGYVTANRHVQAGLSWSNVAWAFSSMEMGHWHPLAWLSHMGDCQLYGLNPAGHHATSIVLHALNAVLLFLLLYRATGVRGRSLMVAALFALHPINVETVAWVSERKSVLSMFFSLCTIGCYGWYVNALRETRRVPWGRYLTMVAAFALALLAKPMAVTLPLVLLLLDYWPLGRISLAACERPQLRSRGLRLLWEKAPLFLLSAVFSAIAVLTQKRGGAVSSVAGVPMSQRLENAALAYVGYIRKMIWPSDLAYFYPHRGAATSAWMALLAAFLLVAMSLAVYRRRARRELVFGWLFFLITLLPVIGIVQIGLQSMADHFAYIPLIGLFIAVVWGLARAADQLYLPSGIQCGIALVLVVLAGVCTMITVGYWQSSVTLFTRAHEVTSPPNVYIETNLAGALSDEGRLGEALICYRRAEKLAPNIFATHYNLGYTLARGGDYAGAVDEFHEALRYTDNPASRARALNSLGIAYLNLNDKPQALAAFTQLLALQPNNGEVQARIDGLKKTQR